MTNCFSNLWRTVLSNAEECWSMVCKSAAGCTKGGEGGGEIMRIFPPGWVLHRLYTNIYLKLADQTEVARVIKKVPCLSPSKYV